MTLDTCESRRLLAGNVSGEVNLPTSDIALAGSVHYATLPGAEGESGSNHQVQITGELPRKVTIRDLSTGRTVFDFWHYDNYVDTSFLSPGNYLLRHAGSGESPQAVSVGISDSGITVAPAATTTTSLAGNLPRFIQIVSRASGDTIFAGWHYDREFDLSEFPEGDYLLTHAASGEGPRTIAYSTQAADDTYLRVTSPSIQLAGSLPRRVQIVDVEDGRTVADFCHYDRELDISVFPRPGTYTIAHAASGELWRRGTIVVGADLPSYRLPGTWVWRLANYASAHRWLWNMMPSEAS